jgi:hypothetical protein
VEDTNLDTGEFVQTVVTSSATSLVLRVQGDHHHLVAYPFTAPIPQTLVLSQGEGGYTGTSDTYIEAYETGVNHGSEEQMTLSNGGNRTPLLRFSLSGVPSGIVVKAAQLSLSTTYRWGSATTMSTALHRLLRSWEANQATWLNAAAGQPWASPGAFGEGQDLDASPSAQREMSAYPATYSYNVSGLVRDWLDNPPSNYGMLLRGSGGSCNFKVGSSENVQPNIRPKLVIKYTYPTQTPTPTNTFTPGPTPTPSTTPSPSPTRSSTPPPTGSGRVYLPVLLK